MVSIYQEKYDRQSNLSMSDYFLKYAELALYLEPKLGDGELMDALRSHFLFYAQRAMLGANIRSIQEAIEFLKRLEIVEGCCGSNAFLIRYEHASVLGPLVQHSFGSDDDVDDLYVLDEDHAPNPLDELIVFY
jgi:hypothetical protein